MNELLKDSISLFSDYNRHVFYKKGVFYGLDNILSILDMHNINISIRVSNIIELDIKIKRPDWWTGYHRSFSVIMSKAKFKKFKIDCRKVKHYNRELTKFLYDEIRLDEKGLCDIITNFAII